MTLLDVENACIAYGQAVAVQDVSLTLDEGSVVALLGPNGAGKSSLARAVAGLVPLRSGRISFRGSTLPRRPADIVRGGIALVPEGRRIFPQLTVEENLLVGGHVRSARDRVAAVKRMQEDFPLLAQRRRQLGGLLSGGEQQLLAICRALMARPSLIVIDEPSLGLSPIMIKEIAAVIRRQQLEGLSVLLVEQNSQFALRLAEFAYILERGVVVQRGSAEALREADYVRKAYLGL
jgi:branched-chain amino acid transport system ATP-binding protein